MTSEGKFKWIQLGVFLLTTTVSVTAAVVTTTSKLQASLEQKLDRQEFKDTLTSHQLRDTVLAVQSAAEFKEMRQNIDTLLRYNKILVMRVCGSIPRGTEC